MLQDRIQKIFLVCSFVLVTSGCATLVNKDVVSVPVYTTPSWAKLFVAGVEYRSPDVVKIPRGQGDYKLVIEKPGYQRTEIMLKESVNAWTGYNVFNLGLGLIPDFATKRAYDLEPEVVHVTLKPEKDKS